MRSWVVLAVLVVGGVVGSTPLPEVEAHLEAHGVADLWVSFQDTYRWLGQNASSLQGARRRQHVFTESRRSAEESQRTAWEYLDAHKVTYRSLWISNSLYVEGASPDVARHLATLKSVRSVGLNDVIGRLEAKPEDNIAEPQELRWNVLVTKANEAWATTRGEGIVVCDIDTGVMYNHESIVGNYRGNMGGNNFQHDYNWQSFNGRTPYDSNGHGTHTTSSVVGSEASGVGIAPSAKWVGCKGLGGLDDTEATLLSTERCAEWAICPTDINDRNPDCSKGVDIVTNSWGSTGSNTRFLPSVQKWIEAGVLPIFSGGNYGSNCGSVNSPAGLELVIAVGASDERMQQASFGSRGPGPSNIPGIATQHPDITAPGVAVWGASTSSPTALRTMSGTSMAAPQVAGLAALILSVNRNLGMEAVRNLLQQTAQQNGVVGRPLPTSSAQTCGGRYWNDWPLNYHYGGGIIDALAAVKAAKATL